MVYGLACLSFLRISFSSISIVIVVFSDRLYCYYRNTSAVFIFKKISYRRYFRKKMWKWKWFGFLPIVSDCFHPYVQGREPSKHNGEEGQALHLLQSKCREISFHRPNQNVVKYYQTKFVQFSYWTNKNKYRVPSKCFHSKEKKTYLYSLRSKL